LNSNKANNMIQVISTSDNVTAFRAVGEVTIVVPAVEFRAFTEALNWIGGN
jgi:hypothetical protein